MFILSQRTGRRMAVKKAVAILLTVLMLVPLFGCGKTAGEGNELWVVTEATTWDHMNGQIAAVAEQFEKDNEGVTVRVDILPLDEQERSVYLQQLRTQILRGAGPDVYLLPTSPDLTVDAAIGYSRISVDPLFSDVQQAMKNGMFRDIAGLYDADAELGKEALKTSVMNAGVVDGKRYVLPLRYDIPVIYADMETMELEGFSAEDLQKPVDELMAQILELDCLQAARGFNLPSVSVFSRWMDYDEQQVSLDADTISAFLQSYQAVRALRGENFYGSKLNVRYYCTRSYPNGMIDFRFNTGSLSELVDYAPVYQHEGRELMVLPMRSMGGDVVADVTYYGAVGSGCKDMELAYRFLRQFLLEDSQWERNRPQSQNAVGEKGRKVSTTNSTQMTGLIEDGWPVRIEGSLEPLWVMRKRQFYNRRISYGPENNKRIRAVVMAELEDHWSDILTQEPDQVRFGSTMNGLFLDMVQSLNDPQTNKPKNADIPALAEKFWWQLRWHVAEG